MRDNDHCDAIKITNSVTWITLQYVFIQIHHADLEKLKVRTKICCLNECHVYVVPVWSRKSNGIYK